MATTTNETTTNLDEIKAIIRKEWKTTSKAEQDKVTWEAWEQLPKAEKDAAHKTVRMAMSWKNPARKTKTVVVREPGLPEIMAGDDASIKAWICSRLSSVQMIKLADLLQEAQDEKKDAEIEQIKASIKAQQELLAQLTRKPSK